MPISQQAISHRLLMTWLTSVGTCPRWNQNLCSLTRRSCPERNIMYLISRPEKAHYLDAEFASTAALEARAYCYSGILQVFK